MATMRAVAMRASAREGVRAGAARAGGAATGRRGFIARMTTSTLTMTIAIGMNGRAAEAAPAVLTTTIAAEDVSVLDAIVITLDARDGLALATEIARMDDADVGRRRRSINVLRNTYGSSATKTSAMLPMVVNAGGAPSADDEDGALRDLEDALLGLRNAATFLDVEAAGDFGAVGSGSKYTKDDIPVATYENAMAAIDALISRISVDTVKKAKSVRCKRLLATAADFEEMKAFASQPACALD